MNDNPLYMCDFLCRYGYTKLIIYFYFYFYYITDNN